MPVRTTPLRAGSLASRLAACAGLTVALVAAVAPVFAGLQDSGAAAPRSSDPAVREAVASIAPTGTLRTGINFGNVILARKDPATGELAGLHVDLARDLASRLGVPIALEGYPAAAPMVEAIAGGRLDVALLSAEAERAGDVTFSPPYLLIEATFLVQAASTARTVADVDREGIRLAVADRSAYDFVLRRWLRRATLVRAPSTQAAFTLFASGGADALVGLRPRLMEDAASLPGSRIVEGGFTTIEQTFATAPDRRAAAAYLRAFTAEAVSSGRIAALVARHRVTGVAVPATPPGLNPSAGGAR